MRTTILKLILTNKEELLGEAEVTGTKGESDRAVSEFIVIQEGEAGCRKPRLQILVKEISKYFRKRGL